MATQSGAKDIAVTGLPETTAPAYHAIQALLRKTPFEFEFFQAVRLLERILITRTPVGRFERPSREVVRFSAHASFPFPASQIQRIEWPAGEMPRMVINFMGLTGPSGVMPLYYTDLINERIRHKDRAMASFFDIFNHRMVSLFYQAWEKYRFSIAYERGERDRVSHLLMDLLGIGSQHLDRRLQVGDDALLFYSGMLSMHTRSALALERVIADYFEVPVEVEQFTGAWHRLGPSDLCRFDRGVSVSERLGGGAIVGDEIWDQQSGVRIRIGPIGLAKYLDFLPSGTAYEPLGSLARFVANGELDFEIQLILKKEEVPVCELDADDATAPRLGWTSWAKTRPMENHAGDTILRGL